MLIECNITIANNFNRQVFSELSCGNCSFLNVFLGNILGKSRNPRWVPFRIHDMLFTPYDTVSSRCGPQREHVWTYHLPYKFQLSSLQDSRRYRGGGGEEGPPLNTEDEETPGLNS